MIKLNILPKSIALTLLLALAAPSAGTSQQNYGQALKFENSVVGTRFVPDSPLNLQSIPYKIAVSMRTREKRSVLILWISTEPENFVREKMLALVHQLNQDFPDEQRISAAMFDSEEAVRNYNPAGASIDISMTLRRGQYYFDRAKDQGYLYFSSQRGKPVNEIKIVLGNSRTRTKRKRARQ